MTITSSTRTPRQAGVQLRNAGEDGEAAELRTRIDSAAELEALRRDVQAAKLETEDLRRQTAEAQRQEADDARWRPLRSALIEAQCQFPREVELLLKEQGLIEESAEGVRYKLPNHRPVDASELIREAKLHIVPEAFERRRESPSKGGAPVDFITQLKNSLGGIR